jgi:hypothetical protein
MFTESRPLSLGTRGRLFLQVRADPPKDRLVSDVPSLRSRSGDRFSARPYYFHFVENLPEVPKGISHQGREGRKEPELIPRCALRYECHDISEGRRLCLPVSQGLVTSRTSHRHQ